MRRGNDPQIFLTRKGEIFGISTGADYCTEHEWGSEDLMLRLVSAAAVTESQTAAMLRSGSMAAAPTMDERRGIRRNLDHIIWVESGSGDKAFGAVAYSCTHDIDEEWLLKRSPVSAERMSSAKEMAGAWDSGSFAFSVRGALLVKKLKAFNEALKEGKGLFAGAFLKDDHGRTPSGVSIVVTHLLRPEHRTAIDTAQRLFEGKVQAQVA